jgi:hypothetical protein
MERKILVVSVQHAFKKTAPLPIMHHPANVAPAGVQQALAFTATLLIISVLDQHAQSPMDQKPTLLSLASVEMSLAMLNLASSATRVLQVILVERRIQVLLVTL